MWLRIHSAHWIFPLVTEVFIKDHLKPTAVSNYLSCYSSKYKFTSLGVPGPLQWEGYNQNLWLGSTCSVWLLVYGGYSSCPIHRGLAVWQLTPAQSLVFRRCRVAFGCSGSTTENAAEPTQSPISSEGCPSDHTALLQTIIPLIPLIWFIFISSLFIM